jgi:hypothetical protein
MAQTGKYADNGLHRAAMALTVCNPGFAERSASRAMSYGRMYMVLA